jgi:plasmid stability protein
MGSDKAMKVADRMITVTLPLAKARMLEAMSMALTELSGVLGIERIDLRVSGDDVTFVPAEQAAVARTAEQSTDQARFSLRLPDDLKARIDERAAAEGTSTNTWMVRALESAVGRGVHHPTRNRRLSGYGQA